MVNTRCRNVDHRPVSLSRKAPRAVNRRQAAWGRNVRQLLAAAQVSEIRIAAGVRPKPVTPSYLNYLLDGKRGVTPDNARAIIASISSQIKTKIYGPAVTNYLTACAHDSGLLPESSEIVLSAAAVLTEGLDDGALWGFVDAANKLEPLAHQRLVADLKVALGKEIVAWLRGRQTTFRLRAICNKHGIAIDDVVARSDEDAWVEFRDKVRITLVAAQRSTGPVGRAKLERKIASAAVRFVRRVGESERKGKH